ncbi:hypothetical protein [Kitasatospora cineracea]|uniref:hypothetical protein n=1 Tax=Kitasatospora cineracea TaxID=88074 RepID=UPI0033E51553
MVTRVELNPLRVEATFPDGTAWTAMLNGTANPRLAEDLAHAIVQLVHPLGTVTSRIGVVQYASTARRMVAELAEAGFSGGVEDLRKAQMLEYWLSVTAIRVERSRMLLKGCGERVDADLRAYVAGKPVKQSRRKGPLQPYSETEWRGLESKLRAKAVQIMSDHREALALVRLGPNPAELGRNRQNFAWLLHEHGPLKVADAARTMGLTDDYFRDGIGGQFIAVRGALFPASDENYLMRTLFGVYCGVVPDGIRDLGLDDFTWAGDRTLLMEYIKRRRGPEAVTLPVRAVRLMERWLELSAPLRRFAPPDMADDVWIFMNNEFRPEQSTERLAVVSPLRLQKTGANARRRLTAALDLRADSGEPLQLHASRIRTTYHNVLARRGWTGRTAIDPNHTREVEGSHYVSTTTPAQQDAVETIIEDAQADVLRRARPPIMLDDDQAAEWAARRPEEMARLGLDEGAMAELLSGEMDVFTAACANQLAGLHGPAGQPCPARPWVCLLCPLAVFAPRHAANLLRLKAYFARQSRQMTVYHFLAVFGPYADRLDHEVLPRFDARLLEAAAGEVADTDSELPLRPEETSL